RERRRCSERAALLLTSEPRIHPGNGTVKHLVKSRNSMLCQHLTLIPRVDAETRRLLPLRIPLHARALTLCNTFNSQFFDISLHPFHRLRAAFPPSAVDNASSVDGEQRLGALDVR